MTDKDKEEMVRHPKLEQSYDQIFSLIESHDLAAFISLNYSTFGKHGTLVWPKYSCFKLGEQAKINMHVDVTSDYNGDLIARDHAFNKTLLMLNTLSKQSEILSECLSQISVYAKEKALSIEIPKSLDSNEDGKLRMVADQVKFIMEQWDIAGTVLLVDGNKWIIACNLSPSTFYFKNDSTSLVNKFVGAQITEADFTNIALDTGLGISILATSMKNHFVKIQGVIAKVNQINVVSQQVEG